MPWYILALLVSVPTHRPSAGSRGLSLVLAMLALRWVRKGTHGYLPCPRGRDRWMCRPHPCWGGASASPA